MKIGLIIYGSLQNVSGGYLYDRKLTEYLNAQGDRVEIISLPWRNYISHLGDNFSPRLAARLKGLDIDLLLEDELNHPSLLRADSLVSHSPAIPRVAIIHHLRSSEARPGWQNKAYRAIERRYLETLDGFIFNSQTTRQVVEDLVGSGRPAVVAHPAGDVLQPRIGDEQIAARARHPGPLRLLFVGNLIPRKGLHTLIDALSYLPRAQCQLTVVGNPGVHPAYVNSIYRQVDRLSLERTVRFTGRLDNRSLAEHMRESQLLVVPSSYEGYGIVYLEGMGFGLPAIATKAGAAAEIITHWRDGLLIQPGDAMALSAHLRLLYRERDRLAAMSLAARRRYQTQPTWEATSRKIRDFLKTMIGA